MRATMTSKGQVTIPVELRQAMGLTPGDRINFQLGLDGKVVFTKLRPAREIAGILGRPPKNADATEIETPFRTFEV